MSFLKFVAATVLSLLPVLGALAGPGALDPSYNPNLSSGAVYAQALEPNGELLIGGSFTTVNGTSRSRIAQLFSNGGLDTGFLNGLSGANNTVNCLAVEGDGRIVIGGAFSTVNGTTRTGVARLNSNGTLDGSFVPNDTTTFVPYPNALAVQSDNKVIIVGGQGSSFVYRLNADGSMDTTFTNNIAGVGGANYPIYAVALQPDGKIIVGGSFTTFGGVTSYSVARMYTNGSVDASFLAPSSISGAVRCLQIQPDGKILIGGDFNTFVGRASGHVVRLTSNGALDTNFTANSSLSGSVYSLALQANNSFLAGGNFSFFNPASSPPGNDFDLARCYPDGTTDTNFFATFNSTINSIVVQSDGGILAGGSFYTVGNQSHYGLVRVYGDLYPPQFVSQPTNVNVMVGSNVTFSAAVGNPTLTYFQWLKNGSAIQGATGMSYSLYNVQLADAGTYAVSASNGLGGNTSSNAVLQVGIPPLITQQPVSLVVTQGQAAGFTVAASGQPLSYLWKKNNIAIPGATNATLIFASAVLTNAASYACTVTNFVGGQTSTAATLTVNSPPAIVLQPANQTVGVGSNLNLSVSVTGTAPLGYQWWKGGSPLSGFTSASLTLTNVQTTNSGAYFVVLTNSLGSVTSAVATVSVIYYPPVITTQPVGGVYLAGTNFTVSATATGTAPLGWQWNLNGTPINGATATGYAVNNAGTNDSGAYTVTVTNASGSVTSSVALVAVGYAPVILQQPQPFTNGIGSSNAFTVTVSGSQPLQYQWFNEGVALPNGTNSQLVLPALQTNQIGYYWVTVTNLFGSVVSTNVLLSISNVALPFQLAGLVAYYPFSGNANDATGNGHNGTVNGAMLAADRFGNAGGAFAFDGGTSFIDLGYSADFNFDPAGQFSLCAWFAIQGNGSGGNGVGSLIVKSPADGTWDYGLEAIFSNEPVLWAGLNGQTPCVSTNLIANGAWVQGVLVYSNAVWQLFENGALLVQTNTPYGITQSSGAVNIGRKGDQSADYFEGDIDDVRIYNRALSTNEVAQLYLLESDVPVITGQPQPQTVAAGATASFSVSATAVNPLFYQWSYNSLTLAGATNVTLIITNASFTQAGNYSVTVSNALTGIASASASLSVIVPITASIPAFGSNQFGFNLTGAAGSNFVVEISTNLQTWSPLLTNTFGTNGFLFLDSGSATNPLRFYRSHY